MERREWAKRLFFGCRLTDKLTDPGTLSDKKPGPRLDSLPLPGRPHEWSFAKSRPFPFPTIQELEAPAKRGQALLIFGNHELLAIEMMAYALLRFPSAGTNFRRDLCATIRDEQRHFKLYLNRAKELGASPQTGGYSSFFWTLFQSAENPAQFSAIMGMGIEQANLDHAHFYGEVFQRIGDATTARILEQVLFDEIQHVHRGLNEVRSSCPEDVPIWDHWTDLLTSPMTPARARGARIHEPARLASGLDGDYILQLNNWAQTKGRPPNIWLFNPFFEERFNGATPSKINLALTSDQEALPLFLAAPHDAVLVANLPSPRWLAHLRHAGLRLPSFIEVGSASKVSQDQLQADTVHSLQPWGVTQEACAKLEPLFGLTKPPPLFPEPEVVAQAASKTKAFQVCKQWLERARRDLDPDDQWLAAESDLGHLVYSNQQLVKAAARMAGEGHRWAVIKRPFGTAGRGQKRIQIPIQNLNKDWFSNLPQPNEGLRIEPWLCRVLDFSTQMFRDCDGRTQIKGHCHTLSNPNGQFWGAHIGPFGRSMAPELRRFLFEDDRLARLTKSLCKAGALILGETWRNQPFGLDHFVYQCPRRGLRMRPFLECNPRWTMGRVALSLQTLLSPGSVGLWLWQRKPASPPSSNDWEQALMKQAVTLDDHGRIIQGTVCTNDPQRARLHLGVLRVEKTTEHCFNWFTECGQPVPSSDPDWPLSP